MTIPDVLAAREAGFKPYALAELNGSEVECISYPFPRPDGSMGIMVRLTPGDPTTMVEATVPPEAADLGRD